MNLAGWRHFASYGFAILLCQALAGCGESRNADTPVISVQKEDGASVAADAPLIVAFGDSLYAGYQLGPREGLAPQLQAALADQGISARVQNAGVSGDTSAAGLQRLTYVLNNTPKKPDLVLLGLGGNDMLRGISPDQTEKNLAAMLDELAHRKIQVVLTGMMAAPNMGREYGARFGAIYPALAKRDGVRLYPFILDGVIEDPLLMLDDHIHPNAAGVAQIAAALVPIVRDALPVQKAD